MPSNTHTGDALLFIFCRLSSFSDCLRQRLLWQWWKSLWPTLAYTAFAAEVQSRNCDFSLSNHFAYLPTCWSQLLLNEDCLYSLMIREDAAVLTSYPQIWCQCPCTYQIIFFPLYLNTPRLHLNIITVSHIILKPKWSFYSQPNISHISRPCNLFNLNPDTIYYK